MIGPCGKHTGQCGACKHYHNQTSDEWIDKADDNDFMECDAFKSIPYDLFAGIVPHNKPYPGDHGIHFELNPLAPPSETDRIFGKTMNTHLENYCKHFPNVEENAVINDVPFCMVDIKHPEDLPKYEALLDMAIKRNKPLTEQEILDALGYDKNPFALM